MTKQLITTIGELTIKVFVNFLAVTILIGFMYVISTL